MVSDLTPAELDVAELLHQGHWCEDEGPDYGGCDAGMAYGAHARAVVAAVRPHLYHEAAARLREICDRNGHGGDCCLTCDRGSDVDLLESLAGEMDQARAAGLEGRGDDH